MTTILESPPQVTVIPEQVQKQTVPSPTPTPPPKKRRFTAAIVVAVVALVAALTALALTVANTTTTTAPTAARRPPRSRSTPTDRELHLRRAGPGAGERRLRQRRPEHRAVHRVRTGQHGVRRAGPGPRRPPPHCEAYGRRRSREQVPT